MDYSYHIFVRNNEVTRNLLKHIPCEIKRGNFGRKELLEENIVHFHTTNFKYHGEYIAINDNEYDKKILTAEAGDILLARVGTRCIGKCVFLLKGRIALSDCIYRIRVPVNFQKIVYKSLKNSLGQEYLKVTSHGVCSKVTSKQELLNLPLISFKKSLFNSI